MVAKISAIIFPKGSAEMVDVEKDTHFKKCIAELDAFIQELHEENKKFAEIRELRQQNKMLVAEIQKLQKELHEKNTDAKNESHSTETNKIAADIRFKRNLKMNDILINILRFEIAAIIAFDIYITFIK